MDNRDLANIFKELSLFLEMDGVPFKPQAYARAALTLREISEDIRDIYKTGGEKALDSLPGFGKSIIEKVVEYISTGKVDYYNEYKKKYPIDIIGLTTIEGLGPKTAKDLFLELQIKNIDDLTQAAKAGKIRSLPRFGEKTERNILKGIEFWEKSSGRMLLSEVLPYAQDLLGKLRRQKGVKRAEIAGSLRRRKETIGDVDILVSRNGETNVFDFLAKSSGVEKILSRGETKISVHLRQGFDVDVRLVEDDCFGAALQYFTGSKEHNIRVRQIAIDQGYKLNEYGLFRSEKLLACRTEEEIYEKLGMEIMPPEIREDKGEVQASINKKLPKLIAYDSLKGDLHCHCDWDGGEDSLETLAKKARELNYEYLGISDHTKTLAIEHGLDEKKIVARNKEIDKLNEKFGKSGNKFRLLKGVEANILADGSVDVDKDVLAGLDFVIAGVHSYMKMSREEMTKRICIAMENPYVDIISHPTGRILKRRDEYEIDIEKIFKKAKETKTVLEINGWPERLDLSAENIRRAKEIGIKMIIDSDSHSQYHLPFIVYGISQARRGWAENRDIINTHSLSDFLKSLKRNS